MIRYTKHEAPGWWYKVDTETGNKIPFNKKHGFYKEMMESGIEIEPLYTPEELVKKEANDLQSALENQKSICLQRLKETDNSQYPDYDYPDDVPVITEHRTQIKTIMRSEQLETIPDKPTF